jgi:hypothetical protein
MSDNTNIAISYGGYQPSNPAALDVIFASRGGRGGSAPPSFLTQPTIAPTGGTAGQTFTATPGTVANGSVTAREWRLAGTVVSTALTYVSTAAGALTYQEFAGAVASNLVAVTVSAAVTTAFTMSQLTSPKRVYQRTTATGGGQSKGTGSIAIPVNVTSVGVPYFRTRASDGTTVSQASTALATFTATGAQTLNITGVDARLGWFYLDLSVDGSTWQNGTVLVGMGGIILIAGQSLASRMLVGASDTISMTTAGVTPDANTSTYVIPGDGTNLATTAAWRSWDATTGGDVGGNVINSAGGAQMTKTLVSQLGVNVAIIGHPLGGTNIDTHTMAGSNGTSIRQIIQDCGGFEMSFLMIGHSNAQALTTGGVGARDFMGGLSAHFQMLTAANPLGTNYRGVVWAIPNETSGGTWGTLAQQNEVRRAMLDFSRSTTASALMTTCRYVNNYSITLAADGTHETQAGAIQIANVVTTAFSSGVEAPATDSSLTATPVSTGTATSATYGTAGKFQAASLDGGYVITQSPFASAGIATVGFWYKGTPANSSVPFSWGNEYVQHNSGRWTWHQASGTETTASTGPTTGTDSTTWHYVSVDRVYAAPDGSGGSLTIYQDGVAVLSLGIGALNNASADATGAIRTFGGSPGGFLLGVPVSDWRGYSKAMGTYVPTAALSATEPFLFVGFPLNGNATAVA